MSTPQPNPAREADIEHQAAVWLARRDRGLTGGEQDEFLQWLAEDPRHGDWFARHGRTQTGLKLLVQWRPEHGTRPNPDLLKQPVVRSRWRWVIPVSSAAAAGIVLAFVTWGPENFGAAAESRAAIQANTTVVLRKVLTDGSTINLNRGAEVEVLFTPDERRVRLIRGEAHFSVAKNPRRPFIVQAEQVEAKAVGTAFNVLLAAQAVEVIVTEGRVQVRPPGQLDASAEEPLVTEGQRAVVSLTEPGAKPRITRIDPNKITQLLSWQFRQLDFADAPLAQVVAEFNRDNHRKIVVDDPALETLLIGASLRSDNIEGFVRMLETSFHVTAERRDDGVIVLRRAPASELR